MKVQLNLSDAKIEGASIKFKGDDVTLLVHFVAPIGVEGVRALGEGVYKALYRNGAGGIPRLNEFKSHDPGLTVKGAVITLDRYPGANPEAFEGSIRSIRFRDADGHAIVDIRARFVADQNVFQMLLAQKQDPMPGFRVEGELRGAEVQEELPLDFGGPVAGAEPKKRKAK
jgi:hypothetical protein